MKSVNFHWAWAFLVILISTVATGLPSPLVTFDNSTMIQPLNVSHYNGSIASQPIKAPAASRYTWWIDGSCTAREGFMAAFNEAREMACLASIKLASSSDWDFETVFQNTFHAPTYSAEQYDHPQFWRRRFRRAPKKTPREHVGCKLRLFPFTMKLLLTSLTKDVLGGICRDWTESPNFETALLRLYCNSGKNYL